MTHTARARVDLNALRHNLQSVKQQAPGAKVLAVIKADGYGHGIIEVGRALDHADGFGVARLEEAIILCEAGITQPILLLEGCFSEDELEQVIHHQLEVVVHQASQIQWLEGLRGEHPIKVWLKVDTGMHRLGFNPDEVAVALSRLQQCRAVAEPIVMMSHFANADDPANPYTAQQIARFSELMAESGAPISLANSAAILSQPDSHGEWVRPGIMLYGANPFIPEITSPVTLKPVMAFSSQLFAIRHCKKGDAIGYGSEWVCPEDMPVGVVAVGYGDGYPRHAPSGTPVLINGVELPIVGRVSMDMICVDLRQCPSAAIGDEVTLWGPGLPVERIAEAAGTIAYELFCGVTSRVQFEYIGE